MAFFNIFRLQNMGDAQARVVNHAQTKQRDIAFAIANDWHAGDHFVGKNKYIVCRLGVDEFIEIWESPEELFCIDNSKLAETLNFFHEPMAITSPEEHPLVLQKLKDKDDEIAALKIQLKASLEAMASLQKMDDEKYSERKDLPNFAIGPIIPTP